MSSSDFFEGNAPGPDDEANWLTSDRLAGIRHDLQQAALEDRAYEHLLSALSVSRDGGRRLTEDELDSMLVMVARAKLGAMLSFPPTYSRKKIWDGLDAFGGLLVHWSQSDEQRIERHPDELSNMRTAARMFQNDCHNMALADQMRRRARRRPDAPTSGGRRASRANVA